MILFYFGTVRSTPDGWPSSASRLTLFGIFLEELATNGRVACIRRMWPRPKPRSPPHRTAVVAPPPGQSTKTPRHPDPAAAVPSTHATLRYPSKRCFRGKLPAPHPYVRHQPTDSLGAPPPRGVLLPIGNRLAQNKNSDN